MSSTPQEKSYGHSDSSDYNPMADWDAAFASDDPTRVLSPLTEDSRQQASHSKTASGTTDYQGAGNYHLPVDDSSEDKTVTLRTDFLESETPRPITATQKRPISPAYIANKEYKDSASMSRPIEAAPVEYLSDEGPVASERFARVQLLPCLLGWLVAYALLSLLSPLVASLLDSVRAKNYGVPGQLLPALQESPAQATPWMVGLGLTIFISYALGGYTASRMARYAAFKQALGVTFYAIFATALSSLITYLFHSMTTSQDKVAYGITFQYLLGNSSNTGFIGLLVYFLLIFVAVCLGAVFGKRYESLHRKMI